MDWYVKLEGGDFDIGLFKELLESPHVDSGSVLVVEEDDSFYLTSGHFSDLEDAHDVMKMANDLLETVNSILRLYCIPLRAISIGNSTHSIEDRQREGYTFLEGEFDARTVEYSIEAFQNELDTDHDPLSLVNWFSLSISNEAVRDALHFFHLDNWSSLYKVYEIVKDDIGGEGRIIELGWASKAQMRDFRQTSQSVDVLSDEARHGSRKYPAPNSPTTFTEARNLIRLIMRRWLSSIEESVNRSGT